MLEYLCVCACPRVYACAHMRAQFYIYNMKVKVREKEEANFPLIICGGQELCDTNLGET